MKNNKQQDDLDSKKKNKAKKKTPLWINVSKRTVEKFSQKPMVMKRLYFVNSKVKPLQKRQCIKASRLLMILLDHCEAEYNQVGYCDKEDMKGMQHKTIRKEYAERYGEVFPESTYFIYIDLLKRAGYLTSKPLFFYDRVARGDMTAIVRSAPSMKTLESAFWADINVDEREEVKDSRARSIQQRVSKKLSNIWAGYKSYNENFKRKLAEKYNQAPCAA